MHPPESSSSGRTPPYLRPFLFLLRPQEESRERFRQFLQADSPLAPAPLATARGTDGAAHGRQVDDVDVDELGVLHLLAVHVDVDRGAKPDAQGAEGDAAGEEWAGVLGTLERK